MKPARVNNFDLIRILASLQVVVFHAIRHLDLPTWRESWLYKVFLHFPGVPIFFVLSGFLISMTYERNPDMRTYARNRLLRIYPALYVCLAFTLVTYFAFSGMTWAALPKTAFALWLVAQLTMGQFYTADFLREYGTGTLNGSLWTIPIELQFYILIPLVYGAFGLLKRPGNGIIVAMMLASIGVNAFCEANGALDTDVLWIKLVWVSAFAHFGTFLLGVLIQRNFAALKRHIEGKALMWLLIFVPFALIAEFAPVGPWQYAAMQVETVVLAFLIMACAFTGNTLSERLLHHNDLSYGTYIYHIPLINILVEKGYTGDPRWVPAVVAGTLALAFLSWRFVEKPALRKKTKSLGAEIEKATQAPSP